MAEESNRYTFRLCMLVMILAFIGDRIASKTRQTIQSDTPSYVLAFVLIVVGLTLLVTILTCIALALLPISQRHSFGTAVIHFYIQLVAFIVGGIRWRIAENATKNPKKRQEALLRKLLKDNADTEYGRLRGFKNIKDREDFRQQHPLTAYDDYRPYIDRLEKGEQGLLTKDPVVKFNVSSGTTGKCKLLPAPSSATSYLQWNFYLPIMYMCNMYRKDAFLAPLKTCLYLLTPRWRYTDLGIPIGPASAVPPNLQHTVTSFLYTRTLPQEAEVFLSEPGQCYLHWFFALSDRDLSRIDGAFGGAILGAFTVLQNNWKDLAEDIRKGRVSLKYDIPADLVKKFKTNELVWADPQRASEIEQECSKGFEAIVQRLWPRITSVSCTLTGAHAIHRDRVQWLCGPKVSLQSLFIYASEAVIAMNMDGPARPNTDDEQLYTLQPDAAFMEFIEEDDVNKPEPKTLFLEELDIGKRYEIVISSIFGFYRYRIGDIVEVVRKRNGKTPVVRFCARVGSLLDLIGEKTSEDAIFAAIKKSLPSWKGCQRLVEFTTTESTSFSKTFSAEKQKTTDQKTDADNGMFYIIFVELDGVTRELTSSEIAVFDRELSEISYPYKSFRGKGSIGKPKVITVVKGTFDKMKEFSLQRNEAISNQYKTPRYLKSEDHLRILVDAAFPNRKAVINSI